MLVAGCWTSSPPPAQTPIEQVEPAPLRIEGCDKATVAGIAIDTSNHDEPLIGATLVVSPRGTLAEEPVAITDKRGRFTIARPAGAELLTTYYLDMTFESKLPAIACDLVVPLAFPDTARGEVLQIELRHAKR